MSKNNKILEMSLDLTPSLKSSVDAMVKGLVLNVNYLDNWYHNFIQKKYGRNTSAAHTLFALWTVIFPFVWTFYNFDERC